MISSRLSIRRPLRFGFALLVALVALVGVGAPAHAQEPENSIRGTLERVEGDEREPVEGVEITVEQDGTSIGTATSAADGTWEVAVPAGGIYQVTLAVETLPDGVAPTDPDRMSLPDVSVRDGQNKTVRFNLGPGVATGGGAGFVDKVGDRILLGLKLGSIIALAAVGLSLIFGVTDLVNFSHAEMITFGAVAAYFFNVAAAGPGWTLVVATIPAIVLSGGFGAAQEVWIWRPLRRRRFSPVSMLVVSIGLSFAVRNVILVILGGEPQNFAQYVIQNEQTYLFFDTVPKNMIVILSSLVILGAVGLFLVRTRAGVAVRAVADNKDLAESSGIDVNRVILTTWILGGALAGLSGVYLGLTEKVQWDMGFRMLLLVFAAVVLGGLGTAFGALVGGFVVGLAVELSTLWLPTELKNAVALAALIGMLLWRPHGLLGSRERIG